MNYPMVALFLMAGVLVFAGLVIAIRKLLKEEKEAERLLVSLPIKEAERIRAQRRKSDASIRRDILWPWLKGAGALGVALVAREASHVLVSEIPWVVTAFKWTMYAVAAAAVLSILIAIWQYFTGPVVESLDLKSNHVGPEGDK